MKVLSALNYQHFFEAVPGRYLILLPDFTIAAVTESYLDATNTTRENILGRGIFEVFPDNPDDPSATGVANLTASLNRVLKNKTPDHLEMQKYDIPKPDGSFEVRYWSPSNFPVLDKNGEVLYIIHSVLDITQIVLAEQKEIDLKEANKRMTGILEDVLERHLTYIRSY